MSNIEIFGFGLDFFGYPKFRPLKPVRVYYKVRIRVRIEYIEPGSVRIFGSEYFVQPYK